LRPIELLLKGRWYKRLAEPESTLLSFHIWFLGLPAVESKLDAGIALAVFG